MDNAALEIDEVRANYTGDLAAVDQVPLEWFEINKRRLTRDTRDGKRLLLLLDEGNKWNHLDGLYHNGQLIAVLVIKNSLVIRLNPVDMAQMADFCYYVGNRHLPIYAVEGCDAVHVPYDGQIYEQVLAKFGQAVQLEDARLLSKNLLRVKKSTKAKH